MEQGVLPWDLASTRDALLFSASQMNGVLLPGGFGRNSETAMLIAEFVNSFRGPLTITKDAIDLLYSETKQLLEREDTLLVVSLAQLQRLASGGDANLGLIVGRARTNDCVDRGVGHGGVRWDDEPARWCRRQDDSPVCRNAHHGRNQDRAAAGDRVLAEPGAKGGW